MTERKPSKLRPHKLHTVFLDGITPSDPVLGRHYTLTHSDRTGDVYLSVGLECNVEQISGAYTRWMRDEVLAQWRDRERGADETAKVSTGMELHVFVHVSGGRIYGRARTRNRTFIRELPRALQSIRFADGYLVKAHPELEDAAVIVHFESHLEKYRRVENWGVLRDYTVNASLVSHK